MPKRSKRRFETEGVSGRLQSRRGIESIREQIELHKEKFRAAEKAGNIGLTEYYEKEIDSMEAALRKKQGILKGK